MPPQRRSQNSNPFGIDVTAVVADAARPHKRRKNPTKKQRKEEERRQRVRVEKDQQKQQEQHSKAEERRLAQEQAQKDKKQTMQQQEATEPKMLLWKDGSIEWRQASHLSYKDRNHCLPLCRTETIMSDEVNEMEYELQKLKQEEWTANPNLSIQGTMRLGQMQHWSTNFDITFREFDMDCWGSTLQTVWETGYGEDRGWQIKKILVHVRNWDAPKSVFQDQSLSDFSDEEWTKVEAIILAVAKKWIVYGNSLQVKIAFTVEVDKALDKIWKQQKANQSTDVAAVSDTPSITSTIPSSTPVV
ncbi:hypothetical protein MMC07_009007 [Pseudocyphellaria aurata]|nr:hypothetical protein [Pseudocyphellaria aurata]